MPPEELMEKLMEALLNGCDEHYIDVTGANEILKANGLKEFLVQKQTTPYVISKAEEAIQQVANHIRKQVFGS